MTTPRLYHFCCSHSSAEIGRVGKLRPNTKHVVPALRLVWLTTERQPDREATGLTMNYITCDRMEHRYHARDASMCMPWLTSPARATLAASDPQTLTDLESYGDPQHWYVASERVPVKQDY
jgi:hypothetical protein